MMHDDEEDEEQKRRRSAGVGQPITEDDYRAAAAKIRKTEEIWRAWQQPAFSDKTIAADPWTAVYLDIPDNPDPALLGCAGQAVDGCIAAARSPLAGLERGPRIAFTGQWKTAAENLAAAQARAGELEEWSARVMGPDGEAQKTADRGTPAAGANDAERIAGADTHEAPLPRPQPDRGPEQGAASDRPEGTSVAEKDAAGASRDQIEDRMRDGFSTFRPTIQPPPQHYDELGSPGAQAKPGGETEPAPDPDRTGPENGRDGERQPVTLHPADVKTPPLTPAAIAENPFQALHLDIPPDADRELLSLIARTAGGLAVALIEARNAAAEGRPVDLDEVPREFRGHADEFSGLLTLGEMQELVRKADARQQEAGERFIAMSEGAGLDHAGAHPGPEEGREFAEAIPLRPATGPEPGGEREGARSGGQDQPAQSGLAYLDECFRAFDPDMRDANGERPEVPKSLTLPEPDTMAERCALKAYLDSLKEALGTRPEIHFEARPAAVAVPASAAAETENIRIGDRRPASKGEFPDETVGAALPAAPELGRASPVEATKGFGSREPGEEFRDSPAEYAGMSPDEAWRQPAFSAETIRADRRTAVGLPIPEQADELLLHEAGHAAFRCYEELGRALQDSDRYDPRELEQGFAQREQYAARIQEIGARIETLLETGDRADPLREDLVLDADRARIVQAWQQDVFSRETIAADPWTAVYLDIPPAADRPLLQEARDWARGLEQHAENPQGALAAPFITLPFEAADHRAAAADRARELEARLEHAPEPDAAAEQGAKARLAEQILHDQDDMYSHHDIGPWDGGFAVFCTYEMDDQSLEEYGLVSHQQILGRAETLDRLHDAIIDGSALAATPQWVLDGQIAADHHSERLTPDELAARVQTILNDPTWEADEPDPAVIQALQERRAEDLEAGRQTAAAEDLLRSISQDSGAAERASGAYATSSAAADPIGSSEQEPEAEIEYDRYTGRAIGGGHDIAGHSHGGGRGHGL